MVRERPPAWWRGASAVVLADHVMAGSGRTEKVAGSMSV